MSTPINHHYVSQCQLRAFFNDEESKTFLFDKKIDNIFYKKTTKYISSEPNLNSAVVAGEVSHNVVEDDLRFYLDDSYSKNLSISQIRFILPCVKEITMIFAKAVVSITQ
jgi:hypothetical protein